MSYFPGHQELQGVLRAVVVTEIDQPLVDDLGPRLGRNVAAQVDVELACYLQIIGRPSVALRVDQIYPAATCNCDQRIGFSCLTVELHSAA